MSTSIDSFFSWLLRASWQASVLTGLVLLAQFFLRKRLDGRWRHLLWLLVMARLSMPFSPPSPASLFNYLRVEPAIPAHRQIVPTPAPAPALRDNSIQPRSIPLPPAIQAESEPPPPLPSSKNVHPVRLQWSILLPTIWTLGFAILAARVIFQN
ncbi:MAG TPA: M56 family metallopeptidase, partial [Verrucomicrobiae bacterium]